MSKRRKTKYNPTKIGGRWVAHQDAMIRILRGLSLTARRILDTLEIEHCRHGGRENGRLVCTYDQLALLDIRRASIPGALVELVSAGLIEIVRPGRRSFADLRVPSLYRLTFEPTYVDGKATGPTHDWKQKAGRKNEPGTGRKNEPGNGRLPDALAELREAKSRTQKRDSYLESGEEGGGGVAERSGLATSPLAHLGEGMGPSAPSPLSDDDLPSVTAPSSGRLH
jgi:hypothetical protein